MSASTLRAARERNRRRAESRGAAIPLAHPDVLSVVFGSARDNRSRSALIFDEVSI
jgi:hypothetical protein